MVLLIVIVSVKKPIKNYFQNFGITVQGIADIDLNLPYRDLWSFY